MAHSVELATGLPTTSAGAKKPYINSGALQAIRKPSVDPGEKLLHVSQQRNAIPNEQKRRD